MEKVSIFAQPWWVNLLVLAPFLAYFLWRDKGLALSRRQLLLTALFAVAFGYMEAAVVVYLRASVGLLPGYGGTLAEVARLSSPLYQQAHTLHELPRALLTVETLREAATMLVLLSVTLLAASGRRERWAIFLWCGAIWDIAYYVVLWATIRWPASLASPDVLFLIPVPWLAQVWFPILVSALTMAAVLLARTPRRVK